MVFQGSRWVLWLFKVPGWFFIVPGRFLWFFKVPGSFFMVPSGFSWFFKVSGCFLRFQVGSEGKSRFQVGFYSCRSVFIVTGGFSCFYGSRWIFIVINGPRFV